MPEQMFTSNFFSAVLVIVVLIGITARECTEITVRGKRCKCKDKPS